MRRGLRMSGFFARFLPSFLPGFGALANPWVLLILGSMLVGAYFYGLHTGNARLESYQVAVKAVGQAQEERTVAAIKLNKKAKEKTDREIKRKLAASNARANDLANRLRNSASGSVVPAAPAAPADPDRICFIRPNLDRALREFTSGTAQLVGEGAGAVVGLDSLKLWSTDTLTQPRK